MLGRLRAFEACWGHVGHFIFRNRSGLTCLVGLTGRSGSTDLNCGLQAYLVICDVVGQPTWIRAYRPIWPYGMQLVNRPELGYTGLFGSTGHSGSTDLNWGLQAYLVLRDMMSQQTWIIGLFGFMGRNGSTDLNWDLHAYLVLQEVVSQQTWIRVYKPIWSYER